jgi:hypothetical protein
MQGVPSRKVLHGRGDVECGMHRYYDHYYDHYYGHYYGHYPVRSRTVLPEQRGGGMHRVPRRKILLEPRGDGMHLVRRRNVLRSWGDGMRRSLFWLLHRGDGPPPGGGKGPLDGGYV